MQKNQVEFEQELLESVNLDCQEAQQLVDSLETYLLPEPEPMATQQLMDFLAARLPEPKMAPVPKVTHESPASYSLDYLIRVADMKNIPRKQVKGAVAEVLEQVNLTPVAHKAAGTFSGGMRQRLGIAQALLGNPRIMIVDEPTAGLDPEERIRFRNLLASISMNRTVLLSTHIVADIERTCSDLAIVGKGRLVFKGSPEELIQGAQGKVWQYSTTELGLAALERQYRIISSRRVNGEVVVKMVADSPGFGQPVLPGLEDAYMAVMGKGQSSGPDPGLS